MGFGENMINMVREEGSVFGEIRGMNVLWSSGRDISLRGE